MFQDMNLSRALTGVTLISLTALTLTGCTASNEAKAFEACKKYVELGYAGTDDVSAYCMETSKGSGETLEVDAARTLITEHNQNHMDDPEYEQIKVDF